MSRIEDHGNPLAVQLEYAPEAEHARQAQALLLHEFADRTTYQHLNLSIDAHTLLFLHQAGTAYLSSIYVAKTEMAGRQTRAFDLESDWTKRVVRKPNITVGRYPRWGLPEHSEKGARLDTPVEEILLYDYDLDTAIEISSFAAWVLKEINNSSSPEHLVRRMTRELGHPLGPVLTQEVKSIIADLASRGLLISARFCEEGRWPEQLGRPPSPNHRFVIASHSPDGVVETGLPMDASEKQAPKACLE